LLNLCAANELKVRYSLVCHNITYASEPGALDLYRRQNHDIMSLHSARSQAASPRVFCQLRGRASARLEGKHCSYFSFPLT